MRWHSTSTYSNQQGGAGTFIFCHLELKKCHNCPFPFYLCSINSMQWTRNSSRLFFCFFHTVSKCYHPFFSVRLTMTSIYNVKIKEKENFSQYSFPVTSLNCNSFWLPVAESTALLHHTTPSLITGWKHYYDLDVSATLPVIPDAWAV